MDFMIYFKTINWYKDVSKVISLDCCVRDILDYEKILYKKLDF